MKKVQTQAQRKKAQTKTKEKDVPKITDVPLVKTCAKVLVTRIPKYCIQCGNPLGEQSIKRASFVASIPVECTDCYTWYQYLPDYEIDYIALVYRFLNHVEGVFC